MTDAETKVICYYSVGGARVDLQNSQYADQPDFWREVNQHFNAGKSVDLVHYRCDRQVRPFGNLLTPIACQPLPPTGKIVPLQSSPKADEDQT